MGISRSPRDEERVLLNFEGSRSAIAHYPRWVHPHVYPGLGLPVLTHYCSTNIVRYILVSRMI